MISLLKLPKKLYITPMKPINQPICWDHELSLDRPYRLDHVTSRACVSEACPDIHYAVHLGILLKGRFTSVYQDFTKENVAGDIWFTAPWEPHAARRTGVATDIIFFSLLPERIGSIGFDANVNWLSPFLVSPVLRPVISNEPMRKKMIDFGMEFKEKIDSSFDHSGDMVYCWLKFHELLLTIIYGTDFQEPLGSSNISMLMTRIAPALKLARDTHSEFPSIDDAASACGLGKSRFSAIFKEAMHVSFSKFASQARIGAAALDVKKNIIPIKEIAQRYGFYDESHFNHVFKHYLKYTPSEYRTIKDYRIKTN